MKKISEKNVIKEYNKGKSTYEIAEKYDTYPNKIRRILKKNGVELRSRSDAQSNALESGRHKHPTKGTERSEETRLKISGSMVDYFSELSDEEREKISEKQKEIWYNKPKEEQDKFIRMGAEAIRKSRNEGSKLEKQIFEFLQDNGYHPVFHDNNILPGRKLEVDISLPTQMTAIEIDGPSHFFPIWGADKLKKQQKFDKDKNAIITNYGFRMIRIQCLIDVIPLSKEKELFDNLLKVLKKSHKKEVVKIVVE